MRRPWRRARRVRRGIGPRPSQIDANGPSLEAMLAPARAWPIFSGEIACAGEGMREAETALGWPARAGKLVLTFALDRVADYYRIR